MNTLLSVQTTKKRVENSLFGILERQVDRSACWNYLPVAYPEIESRLESSNDQANTPQSFTAPRPLSSYGAQPMQKPAILVVEDNPANQRVLGMQLQHLGFRADVVSSGHAAIEALTTKSHGYQIVLMDVQMPGMDGLTATRAIREWERANEGHVRIVAVTAGVTTDNRADCINAGMDDFLTKPLRLDVLRAALQSIAH